MKITIETVIDVTFGLSPQARLCHTASVYKDCMYVHGGHNTQPNSQLFREVLSDMWRYNFGMLMLTKIILPYYPIIILQKSIIWDHLCGDDMNSL